MVSTFLLKAPILGGIYEKPAVKFNLNLKLTKWWGLVFTGHFETHRQRWTLVTCQLWTHQRRNNLIFFLNPPYKQETFSTFILGSRRQKRSQRTEWITKMWIWVWQDAGVHQHHTLSSHQKIHKGSLAIAVRVRVPMCREQHFLPAVLNIIKGTYSRLSRSHPASRESWTLEVVGSTCTVHFSYYF